MKQKSLNSMKRGNIMDIGISTACLYPMITEDATKKLLDIGYNNFEFFVNSLEETTPEFLYKYKEMLDDNDAKIISLHPYSSLMESMYFYSTYERRFTDGLKMYENYFKSAQFLGAKYFVLHGNKIWGTPQKKYKIEEHANIYMRISELANKYGVTVCQENVFGYNSESIEYIEELKRLLKNNISFVLDVKQCIRKNIQPLDMLKVMGENLKHVHISDNNQSNDCLLPGNGNSNLEKFVNCLKKTNYQGALIIEVYSTSYKNINEIYESKKFIQNIVK